jgi:hypothetical protein
MSRSYACPAPALTFRLPGRPRCASVAFSAPLRVLASAFRVVFLVPRSVPSSYAHITPARRAPFSCQLSKDGSSSRRRSVDRSRSEDHAAGPRSRPNLLENPTCAARFKGQTKSSPPPGTSSAATVIAQAVAPKRKEHHQRLHPQHKRHDMERFHDLAPEKYRVSRSPPQRASSIPPLITRH